MWGLQNHQVRSREKNSTNMRYAQLAAAPHKHPHDGVTRILDRFYSRGGLCRLVALSPRAATIVDLLRAVERQSRKHAPRQRNCRRENCSRHWAPWSAPQCRVQPVLLDVCPSARARSLVRHWTPQRLLPISCWKAKRRISTFHHGSHYRHALLIYGFNDQPP